MWYSVGMVDHRGDAEEQFEDEILDIFRRGQLSKALFGLYDAAYMKGYDDGKSQGYEDGHEDGFNEGYDTGMEESA